MAILASPIRACTMKPVQKKACTRFACSECARQKQKCNYQWPCNQCRKRKVAHKCRYKDTNQRSTRKGDQESHRKRKQHINPSTDSVGPNIEDADTHSIDALVSVPLHVLLSLTLQHPVVKTLADEYIEDSSTSPQLLRALQVIPTRPYTNTLVQGFLDHANFHYYILYPPSFLEQYQQRWEARTESKPLNVPWTCLLLMVCACALQHSDINLQRKLEIGLGDTIQQLTERFYDAAHELGSTIPIGYSHLINIQQRLLSCYWLKSEARLIESWHILNSAIREAQQLYLHQEPKAGPVPEIELEIRRRVWSIMDTWDWQSSYLLGRPMIIDRSDCDVGLPSPALEGLEHSPLTRMRMQSTLIRQLLAQFGSPKNVTNPADIKK
ncbi:hypothetical protein MRS44_018620 [Fusarium solani]|uniref:uncharacterized protein n=1 Tax=Fusarium solani TaxID=169388 RepID=UPI0032C3F051|nr:hypothetical protein MRS44_018620 [Fusarium solani]